MFTGLTEEIGIIISTGSNMKIGAKTVIEGIKIGDSIAVNGICLTVTDFSENTFTVDVMPETISKTSLNVIKKGVSVNLERAVKPSQSLGGHIVSGHIDGTGKIVSCIKNGNAIWLEIEADKSLLRHIAPKGSITIDGVSLTVVESKTNSFTVSLIPHTSSVTTLTTHKIGDIVNLETDVIAKYIDHILNFDKTNSTINMEFLEKCGF